MLEESKKRQAGGSTEEQFLKNEYKNSWWFERGSHIFYTFTVYTSYTSRFFILKRRNMYKFSIRIKHSIFVKCQIKHTLVTSDTWLFNCSLAVS